MVSVDAFLLDLDFGDDCVFFILDQFPPSTSAFSLPQITEVGLQAFTVRKIILTDGMDIYEALARRLSIPDIIAAKIRHASETRRYFKRVRGLFLLWKRLL